MNLLVRFFDPASGRIPMAGVDLWEMRHRSLRRQVAMVLQGPFADGELLASDGFYASLYNRQMDIADHDALSRVADTTPGGADA
ncbi:hypothetical protein NBH00_23895 [Paraconexibacter antarcticus]|uniref:Uncharacterized protein n=1 Tax=Paraconexibacter antarcticus TaxID=2949664 RepID=A0ABY5DU71_9ACTN|nr:hypothetical protein NBH00_23895 [Paraconexibacter antarcticus]